MDSSGTDELQAHVAAWHNRHLWAERIAPAQVSGVGVVSLPFQPGVRGALAAKVAARLSFKLFFRLVRNLIGVWFVLIR